MILVAYRHGPRASELIHLTWQQVDLDTHRLTVYRLKNGEPSVHPLGGREIRGLRKLRRDQPFGRYVFVTARTGGPMTRGGFFKLPSDYRVLPVLQGHMAPLCLHWKVWRTADTNRIRPPEPQST